MWADALLEPAWRDRVSLQSDKVTVVKTGLLQVQHSLRKQPPDPRRKIVKMGATGH